MGAGRKTETILVSEKVQRTSTPGVNCSVPARNLKKKDLGAVIFGCTRHTMDECLTNKLFGLPAMHISYIKNIDPGLPLFLFNYSDRKLHGIYEATSHGCMNIDPFGWTKNGCDRTLYPAQVRIRIRKLCQPLLEDQYGPIIHKNYINDERKVHFRFELDHKQTQPLIALFECSPIVSSFDASYNVSINKAPHIVVSSVDKLPANKASCAHINMESGLQYNIPISTGKWASLFKENSDVSAGYEVEDIRSMDSEANWDEKDLDSLNLSHEEKQMLGIHSSKVTTHEDIRSMDSEANWDEKDLDSLSLSNEEKQMLGMHCKVTAHEDEDRKFSKLKQLAHVRDSSDLYGGIEDHVSCGTSKTTTEDAEENGYTDLLQSTFDRVYSNMEEHTEVVPCGMDSMCLIDQLRKEVEEWKGFSLEQQKKGCALEKKLILLETYSMEQHRRTSALEKKLDAIEREQASLKKRTAVAIKSDWELTRPEDMEDW